MLISYLPFEIVEHINDYLLHEDRYQLVFVNHTFYTIFIRLLYRTICIESHLQFKQLIHNFKQYQSTYTPLGHYVYDLSILLDQLSESDLKQIQSLCPFVQSINIDWRIWNYLSLLNHPFYSSSDTRNYHPRKALPLYANEFISNYGACKLSSLTMDLYHITNIDPTALLAHTPYLRSLVLMGINQYTNISFEFVEFIHQSCPYLEALSLDGYRAEIEDFQVLNSISPLKKMKSFKLNSQYGADRFQHWLPYIGKKYPQLTQLEFIHSGEGKDLIEPCPVELYRQFINRCPNLTHLSWKNTAPGFHFFEELDRVGQQKLTTLNVSDNLPISSLLTHALFSSSNHILKNVTELSFGPLPRDITPNDLVQSIAQACPRLKRLSLREPHCNPASPFKIDIILNSCRALVSLHLERIALRVSFYNMNGQSHHLYDNHPLEQLDMHHCSSFDGVFEHISIRCPKLTHLNLFAFTQRDRRYKVQIHLPYQQLKKVQLHSLRTETFDMDRRIRFFSIQHQDERYWYYMHDFEVKDQETLGRSYSYRSMEIAKQMVALNSSEVYLLCSFVEKPMPWSDVDARIQQFIKVHPESVAQYWSAKDIYDAGHVDFVCDSVKQVYLNKKSILF